MKSRPGEKIKMLTVDELLGVPEGESAVQIAIEKIYSFENHPFKVIDDEKMDELMESIYLQGILTPVLVRPDDEGGYEMISGHRRMHAARRLGLETIPAIVKEMTDDEATIAMVNANIQREELLPSERAFSYKMKMDAMKRQGSRRDLTCGQNGHKLIGIKTRDLIAEGSSDSARSIQRYIRLTELIPEILDYVDNSRIPVMTGVDISYLPQNVQKWLYEYIKENGTVKGNQIAALRSACSSNEDITQKLMIELLNAKLPIYQPSKKISFSGIKLKQYFPPDYTPEEMEKVILQLLAEWKQGQERR